MCNPCPRFLSTFTPSRRSGGSEEPSDRREERTRAWGTERRRDERDGGKGRKKRPKWAMNGPSVTHTVHASLVPYAQLIPFPSRRRHVREARTEERSEWQRTGRRRDGGPVTKEGPECSEEGREWVTGPRGGWGKKWVSGERTWWMSG